MKFRSFGQHFEGTSGSFGNHTLEMLLFIFVYAYSKQVRSCVHDFAWDKRETCLLLFPFMPSMYCGMHQLTQIICD